MRGIWTAMKHLGLPRRHHDSHLPHEKLSLKNDKVEPHNALGLLNPSSKYFETWFWSLGSWVYDLISKKVLTLFLFIGFVL